jgi:glutamine amidotransferase
MITLVDYGLGNIQAFANIYKSLGIACSIARDAQELSCASRLILPGVGAFDWAMQRLEASGMRPVLDDLVLNERLPVLGICVGMQMMANSSEEGSLPGLGWIPGEVKRFDASLLSSKISLPHMGWNDIVPKEHPLFANISDPRFYFLHSYFFLPCSTQQLLAEAQYGESFAAAVCRRNVIGVQFHPEKSHHWGVQLLQNFAEFQS